MSTKNLERLAWAMGAVVAVMTAFLVITSCNSEMIVDPAAEQGALFQIRASIGNQTKAATNLNDEGPFATGDKIMVTLFMNGSAYTQHYQGIYTFDGAKWESTSPYYLSKTAAETVLGCYPVDYVTIPSALSSGQYGVGKIIPFTVQTDQSDDTNYKNSDFMVARSTASYSSPACTLEFEHQLCKIVIKLTGILATNTASDISLINVKKGSDVFIYLNLDKCGFTESGEATTIKMKTASQAVTEVAAIIPPQVVAAGTDFFKVIINGKEYKAALSDSEAMTFESNTVYTYNVALDASEFVVTGSSIAAWGTEKEPVDIIVSE